MIYKQRKQTQSEDIRQQAAARQEQDVAWYLARAFEQHNNIHVFNDLRLRHQGHNAQIDHLIIHPHGFILIESKSITGEVKINPQHEWQRSFRGNWLGMRSPIKQVELQQKLLRSLLLTNLHHFIESKSHTRFSKCSWHHLCTISSNAIIDRDSIPENLNHLIVKNEFLVDRVVEIVKQPTKGLLRFLRAPSSQALSDMELRNVCDYLLTHNRECSIPTKAATQQGPSLHIKQADKSEKSDINAKSNRQDCINMPTQPLPKTMIKCKSCDNARPDALIPQHGKFGYFVKCSECQTNTSMKQTCPSCHSKTTKISKRKNRYFVNCQMCGHIELVFEAPQLAKSMS